MENNIKIGGYLNISKPNQEGEFLIHNIYNGHLDVLDKEKALKLVKFIKYHLKNGKPNNRQQDSKG